MRKSNRVCCFGELLFRFMPSENFAQANSIGFCIGGAELNVARALSRWGVPTSYITALPENYLAKGVLAQLETEGINTSSVCFAGTRVGCYYLPAGLELKHFGVVYDRDNSTFSTLNLGKINWNKALEEVQWLHISAISPALNKNVAALVLQAVETAKIKRVTVSIDLNYRAKLWNYGVAPPLVMQPIVEHCDVVMGNIWAMETLLGIKSTIIDSKGKTNNELLEATKHSITVFLQRYKVSTLALTFRLEHSYWAVLHHTNKMEVSEEYFIKNPLDKVGTGDCFMAGLLYGLYHGKSPKEIINFSVAAAVGKHYELGDVTKQTIQDIHHIMKKP